MHHAARRQREQPSDRRDQRNHRDRPSSSASTVVISLALIALGALFRMPSVYLVFALTLSFVYLSSRFVEGLPRYFSVVFPLYIAVALGCRRWPKATTPVLALSASLQSLSVILFVNGYWFT